MTIIIVTSFGGRKPPSAFYEQLRKMGLQSDRNRIRTVASASLAAAIVRLAQRYGGIAYAFPEEAALDADAELGLQPLPESEERDRNWVVTCYECARSYPSITDGPAPSQCPVCLSFAVHSRPGKIRPAVAPARADPFTQWLISRFFTGWLTFPEKVNFVPSALELPPVDDEWKSAVEQVRGLRLPTLEEMDAAICLAMYPFQHRVLPGVTPREKIYSFLARKRRK